MTLATPVDSLAWILCVFNFFFHVYLRVCLEYDFYCNNNTNNNLIKKINTINNKWQD